MSQPVPERHLNAQCGLMLAAGGVMSYRCTLKAGHDQAPPEDPEPCWAVEVSMSQRRWADWKVRQDARDRLAKMEQGPETIECPRCLHSTMRIFRDAGIGRCTNCGDLADIQTTADPATPEQIVADIPEGRTVLGQVGQHTANTATVSMHDGTEVTGTIHAPSQEALDGILREPVTDKNPNYVDEEAVLNSMRTKSEPTKQRSDDQRLPNKGHRIVQDWIIDAMEESKRVGSERYGQPLMTFDSRLNIKDLAEELRDAYVYVSKLQMIAEADKGTLIEVVTKALDDAYGYDDPGFPHEAAVIAVDAILDWVLIQKVGVDQVSAAT